jgi:hypothetical protein
MNHRKTQREVAALTARRVGAGPTRAEHTRPCLDRTAYLNRIGGPDLARC